MASEEKSQEELRLEKLVFGDTEGFQQRLGEVDFDEQYSSNDEEPDGDAVLGDDLFFVDTVGEKSDNEDASMDSAPEFGDESSSGSDAWVDSDDEQVTASLQGSDRLRKLRVRQDETKVSGRDYINRLRNHFEKLHPRPKWAILSNNAHLETNSDSSDAEEVTIQANPLSDLLQKKTSYVHPKSAGQRLMPTSNIDISRLQDVNKQNPSKSAIQTLEFHPTHPLALTAGYDRTLRIYHVDGKVNPLATSLHVTDSPFQTALFHPAGQKVFAGGRRRYLYIWDLQSGAVDKLTRMYGHGQTQQSMEKFVLSPDGKYIGLIGSGGWMNVLSAQNGQWITGAKVDGVIADIVWNNDDTVTIANKGGDVYEWNAQARKFSSRWRDEAGVGITTLAQTDRWCAVGASNGMVNVYDRTNPKLGLKISEAEPDVRVPNFVIDNLVTTISTLRFSPNGQMLSIGSRAKRDAFRIAHVPSFSVFQNWPTSVTPLGRVTCAAFAPGSQMLSTGNEAGYARLFSINHFSN